MKRLLIVILVLGVASRAGAWWPPTGETVIEPANPTSSDVVTITVWGQWPDSCVPHGSSARLEGNNIYLNVIWEPGRICADVISGWSETQSIGPLSPGIYTMYAGLSALDGEYTKVKQFVVTNAAGANMVAHWRFDEGGGSVAYDSAGDNDGVVSGSQWTTGQIEGALSFDGINDYVALPDNNPIWLPQNNFTLSAWVYFDRAPAASGGETFLGLNYAASGNPSNELGYVVSRLAGSGRAAFGMHTITTTDENLYSNEVLSGGRWYHVVALRDGTTQAIYIDGQLDNSRTCSPDPIDFVGGYDDDKVSIGRVTSAGVGQYYVDGKIDDVRIYDQALSALEIQEFYGQAQNGLVGHWRFDEGGGSVAYDSAGDNDGVVSGSQWTTGQIEGALSFDGINDYVALPDNNPIWLPQNNFTLSAWVYFDRAPAASGGETFLGLNYAASGNPSNELGYVVSRLAGSGRAAFGMHTITTTDENLYSNEVLSGGRWYHVVALRDGTTQAIYIDGQLDNSRTCSPDPIDFVGGYDDDKVSIGRVTSAGVGQYYVDGRIDDVRIYDRALSAPEIQELYGQAQDGLVAYWRFEEGSGLIAYDSAGDNDGVVSGARWTTGYIDGALDFDGVDDYVQVQDDPSLDGMEELTVCAWFKPEQLGRFQRIVSKWENGPQRSYVLSLNDLNKLVLGADSRLNLIQCVGATTLDQDRWYHGAGVYDRNGCRVFIDGRLDATAYEPGRLAIYAGSLNLRIGAEQDGTYLFGGPIDDVRIYKRALSVEEIRELYGAAPAAAVYHIDGVAGNDSNDGLSRETAFKTIQKGIDASDDGDEVVVWPGVYQEAINFKGKAIAVKSAAEPAVIDATRMDAVTFHAGEGPGSVLKNFIIRNSGMAISTNYGSSPTISNLTIVNNDFGIGAYEDSDPNVSNCIIWNNKYGDLFGCEARYSWVQQELEPDLEDPNGGLVSHWAFDEGAGLIAYDSASSNDGVVFGAKWASGQLGGALDFDGADDYLEVSDNANLSLTGAVTVGAWIWLDPGWLPPGHGGAGVIVCKHRDVTGKGYSLRVQASRHLRALLNGNAVVSQSQVPVGRWTYVALTFDSSAGSVVLYINGSEDSSVSIAGTLTGSGCGLRIGDQSCYAGGTGSEVFYGVIDDVRIYGRALSASEVLQLYEPVAGIDPLFADPAGGDYHLLSERGRYWPAHDVWVLDRKTSPCIDGGDPAVDPSGEPMPNGGRINIGAYGGTVQASMSEWPIASDYNRDGRTNFEDLAIFCEEWLATFPWADGQPAPPEPEPDLAPPTPNPATWDVEPYSTSSTVSMAATVASDESGVEYYFENVTVGWRVSGWQASNNWTDTGLTSSTRYCYRVKTRDKSPNMNESAWSSAFCATTSSGGR